MKNKMENMQGTDIKIKDEDGCVFSRVGYGETIEEVLKDTIEWKRTKKY